MVKKKSKKKKQIIHRSKLFKGQKTAQEIHAQYGFRSKCLKCGGPPVIRVKMMMHVTDFKQKAPEWASAIALTNPKGQDVPTIPTTYGPMVKYADVTACRHHAKDLELTAAKAPSWVLVEIDRGPGADNPVVQVLR